MAERFLKFIPSEEAFWLLNEKPNAFRLLTHIANTARRTQGNPDGLLVGECHLQHWTFYKLTEQEYRTAKAILVRRHHVKIQETNRTRKKSTTGSTTNSTLVKLISSTVYDINLEDINDQINDRATTEQRPSNDKQEREEREEGKEKKDKAQTAKPRLRSKDVLYFDFESWQFVGISEKDVVDWVLMYPHIDLKIETLKAAQWLKNNPSKSGKKNWRKYLTGWFGRSNDSIENKKAYKSAMGGSTGDRRTKDIDGNPVENQHQGKF